MKSIKDHSIPLQIHDIPYSIESFTQTIENTKNGTGIVRDFGGWDMTNIDFVEFAKQADRIADVNSNIIIFYNNWLYLSDLVREMHKYFDVDLLVWYKTNPKPQIRKRRFVNNHELIIYCRRGKYTLNWSNHSDMYSIKMNSLALGKDRIKLINDKGKRVSAHPTQKPVKLIQYYIEKLSNPGETILDAYAGVLTTGMAALRSNRKFIVNDLNSDYVNSGIKWIKDEFPNEEIMIHNKGEM